MHALCLTSEQLKAAAKLFASSIESLQPDQSRDSRRWREVFAYYFGYQRGFGNLVAIAEEQGTLAYKQPLDYVEEGTIPGEECQNLRYSADDPIYCLFVDAVLNTLGVHDLVDIVLFESTDLVMELTEGSASIDEADHARIRKHTIVCSPAVDFRECVSGHTLSGTWRMRLEHHAKALALKAAPSFDYNGRRVVCVICDFSPYFAPELNWYAADDFELAFHMNKPNAEVYSEKD